MSPQKRKVYIEATGKRKSDQGSTTMLADDWGNLSREQRLLTLTNNLGFEVLVYQYMYIY